MTFARVMDAKGGEQGSLYSTLPGVSTGMFPAVRPKCPR
jgi:hypothetical protein